MELKWRPWANVQRAQTTQPRVPPETMPHKMTLSGNEHSLPSQRRPPCSLTKSNSAYEVTPSERKQYLLITLPWPVVCLFVFHLCFFKCSEHLSQTHMFRLPSHWETGLEEHKRPGHLDTPKAPRLTCPCSWGQWVASIGCCSSKDGFYSNVSFSNKAGAFHPGCPEVSVI